MITFDSRRPGFIAVKTWFACLLPGVLASDMLCTYGAERVPACTEAQLERDWHIQARMSPTNLRALALRDAASVIDGIEIGRPEQQTPLGGRGWSASYAEAGSALRWRIMVTCFPGYPRAPGALVES